MKIVSIVGIRPNFVKIAPFIDELKKYKDIQHVLVHTGQHYDFQMSEAFFKGLHIPAPDHNLGIQMKTHASQVGEMMMALEDVLIVEKPNIVVVVGDGNSTLAGALAAAKLNIPIAHIEAGLRSFDKKMPEEINRILTDHISTWLFTTERPARINLAREGLMGKEYFVGNIMIDTLLKNLNKIKEFPSEKAYDVVLTLHRPSNVDDHHKLFIILKKIDNLEDINSVGFFTHPRVLCNKLKRKRFKKISLCEPLCYLEFLSLVFKAKYVITDSGGLQEETSVLGVPCITLRDSTERPITESLGTNKLCKDVKDLYVFLPNSFVRKKTDIPLWDGKTAERIVNILRSTK